MSTPIKRTWESLPYTILCAPLLDTGETITSVVSVTADQGALTFGTPVVNPTQFTTTDGSIIPANTAIQVQISSGTIPANFTSLECVVRARFNTSESPNAREATMYLILSDQP